jgi:hypothetical protein
MKYAIKINEPAWFWRPVARVMKPICGFPVLLPLAALGFIGALLLISGQRYNSRTMIVAGLVLSIPFALWAALFLSFLVVVMVIFSATVLSGRASRGVGPQSEHGAPPNGGPAMPSDNSGAGGGPPSVS